jgi:Spy/CpxP family protein refolding chaperone
MTKKLLSILALAALPAVFLPGQMGDPAATPPTAADMVANRVARLTKLLTLTTAQQTQATAIFTAEQAALDAVVTPMQTARTALKTAVQKNDTAGINAQALAIGSLTAQQVAAQGKADAAFYAILTEDQKAIFDELRLAGLDGPGRGGPAPGDPGPGGRGPRN